jgi:polysaccharide export outer membrane protein
MLPLKINEAIKNRMYFKNVFCNPLVACLLILCTSCSTVDIIRFKKSEGDSQATIFKSHINYVPLFQKNDIIQITLISNNEEFSKLFSTALDNGVRNQQTYTSGVSAMKGFIVQQDGTINVPYVGKITVHDKTREEVIKVLTEKLKVYIKEPVVQLKILNFKITVLGDVKNPGTFSIPNEKITFIEALGIAGDLNITANIKEISIFREERDSILESNIDLSSKSVFYSPYFMLKQNDMIYVPPNKAKSRTAKYSPVYIPLLTSISLLLTTLNLILNN